MANLLHIGHGKTGSSSIQSFLANNAILLNELGHPYPDSGERDFAKWGGISSGNGRLVIEVNKPIVENAIYSSEILFRQIPASPNPRELLRRISPASILIFTRDLHQHSWSSYGQSIKRKRETSDYLSFIKQGYGWHLDHLLWWFEICADLQIDLKVWNYSRREFSLIHDFLQKFLLIQDPYVLSRFVFSSARVNRSLSQGELELQRIFNTYQNSPGHQFLSDRWVTSLPEIESSRAPLTLEIASTLESLFKSKIEEVNKFISEEDKILMWDPSLPKLHQAIGSDSFVFSGSQLAAIVDGVQSYVERNQFKKLLTFTKKIFNMLRRKLNKS